MFMYTCLIHVHAHENKGTCTHTFTNKREILGVIVANRAIIVIIHTTNILLDVLCIQYIIPYKCSNAITS